MCVTLQVGRKKGLIKGPSPFSSQHIRVVFSHLQKEKNLLLLRPAKKSGGGWKAEEGSLGPPHPRPQFRCLTPTNPHISTHSPPQQSRPSPKKKNKGAGKVSSAQSRSELVPPVFLVYLFCSRAFSGAVFWGATMGLS